MGVVYHGNYIPYFEIGRVEWLRDKGISYKSLEENGIALPIVSMTLNYKKPARYDDLLTVKTKFKKHSSVKIEFDCEIWSEEKINNRRVRLTTSGSRSKKFSLCF
jgi:acyl-CoA thioester hydrolase